MKSLFSIAVLALTVMPATAQTTTVGVTSYRGIGYTVWFPTTWSRTVTGSVLSLEKSGFPPMAFKIFASPERDKDAFFAEYRKVANSAVGFPVTFGSATQPMVYGNWFGTTIQGDGQIGGVPFVVSATAIEANGYVYLLQMVAPLQVSWTAHEVLAALGRSLVFDNPTTPGGVKGSGDSAMCGTGTQCLGLWTSTMSRITSQTVESMR